MSLSKGKRKCKYLREEFGTYFQKTQFCYSANESKEHRYQCPKQLVFLSTPYLLNSQHTSKRKKKKLKEEEIQMKDDQCYFQIIQLTVLKDTAFTFNTTRNETEVESKSYSSSTTQFQSHVEDLIFQSHEKSISQIKQTCNFTQLQIYSGRVARFFRFSKEASVTILNVCFQIK